jgi:hypothetical protein
MGSALLLFALAVGQPAAGDLVAVSPAGDRPAGRVVKLTPDMKATLATATGSVEVADVISLRRAVVPLPNFPRGPGLLTTTGDRVPGQLLGGYGQVIRFRPAAAKEPWEVPLPAVAVLWLGTPPAGTPPDPDRIPWLGPNRKRDLIRLRNGDLAMGTVVGFVADGSAVRFKPDAGEERMVPLGTVAAVAFNPVLATARRPKGAYAHVVLNDGTRLDLTGATADATQLTGKTLFGQPVALAVADVVAIDAVRGKSTDLSALKPKVEQGGYLGVPYPWAADRTVRGEPLRLLTPRGVETFDRGIGTHPRTVLTYDLAGKYRRFEALIGLDPVSGRQGRAEVRIAVDGNEQPSLYLVPASVVPVRVELAGRKQLSITVDFAGTGGVQADVNWADARLVE